MTKGDARGFTCKFCDHVGDPVEVDREIIVGHWYVVCSNCGGTQVVREAYADARVEKYRRGEK